MTDNELMLAALEQAKLSFKEGEVPVGAVISRNGEIVSLGRNRRENGKNALAHAEIEAIDLACKKLGGWRLWECDMYVTLEPCPMCAGAIINLFDLPYNHKPEVIPGLMEDECSSLLSEFFAQLRIKK